MSEDPAVRCEIASPNMVQLILTHMECVLDEASEPLQTSAAACITDIAPACEVSLCAETLGALVGTVLWLLESPSTTLIDTISSCIAGLCMAKIDGLAYATTVARLGGGSRLSTLEQSMPGQIPGVRMALDALEATCHDWRAIESQDSAVHAREAFRHQVQASLEADYRDGDCVDSDQGEQGQQGCDH